MFEAKEITYSLSGRKTYICECSVCGADCRYLRKIQTEPICFKCKREKKKISEMKSQQRAVNDIYNQAIDDVLQIVKSSALRKQIKSLKKEGV